MRLAAMLIRYLRVCLFFPKLHLCLTFPTALPSGRQLRLFVHKMQLLLSKPAVSPEALRRSAQLLRPRHYKAVVEERVTMKLCGYPPCSRALGAGTPRHGEADRSLYGVLVVKPHVIADAKSRSALLKAVASAGFRKLSTAFRREPLSPETAQLLAGSEAAGDGNRKGVPESAAHMSSGPCIQMLVRYRGSGEDRACTAGDSAQPDIVERLINLVGPADPARARVDAPSSLRARFGVSCSKNAVYCSPTASVRDRDARLLFLPHPRQHGDITTLRIDRASRSVEKNVAQQFCGANCATKSALFLRNLNDDPLFMRPKLLALIHKSAPQCSAQHAAPRPNDIVQMRVIESVVSDQDQPPGLPPPKPRSKNTPSQSDEKLAKTSGSLKLPCSRRSRRLDQRGAVRRAETKRPERSVAASKPAMSAALQANVQRAKQYFTAVDMSDEALNRAKAAIRESNWAVYAASLVSAQTRVYLGTGRVKMSPYNTAIDAQVVAGRNQALLDLIKPHIDGVSRAFPMHVAKSLDASVRKLIQTLKSEPVPMLDDDAWAEIAAVFVRLVMRRDSRIQAALKTGLQAVSGRCRALWTSDRVSAFVKYAVGDDSE